MGYWYRPYRYRYLYRLIWISVISVSAKYRLKYMDIGKNIGIYRPKASYRLNIGQHENIGIGIGGRYVGANISVSVSEKISALRIYLYRYRPDPYRSNPTVAPWCEASTTLCTKNSQNWFWSVCAVLGRCCQNVVNTINVFFFLYECMLNRFLLSQREERHCFIFCIME